jgi:hypothetical protein
VKRLVILAGLGWVCAATAADFREFNWGSPIAAIRGAEAAWPVFATDSLLEYETEYAGRPMSLLYRFAGGRLDGGSYHFEPFRQCGGNATAPARRHACERHQVSAAFLDLVRLLSRQYGWPADDALNALCFRDAARIERYVGSKDDFGRSAMCVWQGSSTTVTLNASHALASLDERRQPYAELQVVFSGARDLVAAGVGVDVEERRQGM